MIICAWAWRMGGRNWGAGRLARGGPGRRCPRAALGGPWAGRAAYRGAPGNLGTVVHQDHLQHVVVLADASTQAAATTYV